MLQCPCLAAPVLSQICSKSFHTVQKLIFGGSISCVTLYLNMPLVPSNAAVIPSINQISLTHDTKVFTEMLECFCIGAKTRLWLCVEI